MAETKTLGAVFWLACVLCTHAQIIDEEIHNLACGEETRPVLVDANDARALGPFDSTYENRTYAPNMLCEWHIRMEDTGEWQNVYLNWLDFDVEVCTECKCDHVTVYDGANDQAPLIGQYCGDEIPPNIVSSNRDLFVRWVTDATGERGGFLARYGPPLDDTACTPDRPERLGGPIGSSGIFLSPNYPNNYPPGANCQWLFEADAGGRVRILMLDFATDEQCQPAADRLDLYNGATAEDGRMIRHTGWENYFPVGVESAGTTILAHFSTDNVFHWRGFFGLWEIIE